MPYYSIPITKRHIFLDILKIPQILHPLNLNSRSFPQTSFMSCSSYLSEWKPHAQNHQQPSVVSDIEQQVGHDCEI